MRNLAAYLPSIVLVVCTAMLVFCPQVVTAGALALAAVLWAFWYFISEPIKHEEPRFKALDEQMKDLAKQVDSVKTAVGMRQLR